MPTLKPWLKGGTTDDLLTRLADRKLAAKKGK